MKQPKQLGDDAIQSFINGVTDIESLQFENRSLKECLAKGRPCELCTHMNNERDESWVKHCEQCRKDNNNWEWASR